MSNTWGQPPAAPGPTPEPWQPPKKRRTGVIVTAAAVAVLVIGGAAAGGWYLFQDDEDGDALTGPAFTTAAESAQDTAQDGTDTASSVTTVTVTASSDADEDDDGADAVSATAVSTGVAPSPGSPATLRDRVPRGHPPLVTADPAGSPVMDEVSWSSVR